jgi:hypothetical protein
MSNRQMYENQDYSDSDSDFEENFFFDSDASVYSDDDDDFENKNILDKIELKRKEEEQLLNDQKQIQGLKQLDISSKYDWKVPVNIEIIKDERFPDLLECLQTTQKSPKNKKLGAGFSRYTPTIVFGRTDISVKPVMCTYFLKGNCTRTNCPYYHPVDVKCKFDTNCTNPKCVFVHSPRDDTTTQEQKTIEKPQTNEKCKHRMCLNTLQIVNNKVVPTQKICKHGENCNFAHSTDEIETAVKANQDRFKCNFGKKCRHVSIEISQVVKNNKPIKCYKYTNKTEFCGCQRVHHRESINNFIVRVHMSRRPQKTTLNNNA